VAADGWRLAVLVAAAVGIHAWLVSQTAVPARDGVVFARYACRLDASLATRSETPLDVVRSTEHPPGYPLAVSAVAGLTGQTSPDGYLWAAQVANSVAGVLLVVPCYFIGRQLFGPNVGFAAALLFQVLPVPAHVTSDALSEGLFLLLAASSVACGVRAVKGQSPGWFVACGLAAGASYLVRPEGLMTAVAPVLVVLWGVVRRRVKMVPGVVRVAAVTAGVAVFAAPYMAAIGRLTNKPTGVQLQSAEVHGGPLFAAWAGPDESKAAFAVKAVPSEVGKTTHYGVGVLAVVGAVVLWRRFARDPGWWVLTLTTAFTLGLLVFLAARRGYISERHAVLFTLLACQFAAALVPAWAGFIIRVIPPVGRIGPRVTAAVLLAVLVLSAVPFAVKPQHRNREVHKQAGRWLAEHADPADAVVDPYTMAEWYAGRTRTRLNDWSGGLPPVTYVVLENTTARPESPMPLLEWARELAKRPDAVVVKHWPEGVPVNQAKLHVWKVTSGP
jgi:4-amino-4-deoxy-L-arabinose transferase-like glycosyltransferase